MRSFFYKIQPLRRYRSKRTYYTSVLLVTRLFGSARYHYVAGFVLITGRAFAHNSCSGIGPGRANPNTCRRPPGNVTSRHVMSRRAGERTPGLTPDDPVTRPDGNRSNRRPGDLCTSICIKDSRV